MQSLSQIRALLDAHGLRPRKRLGQHFLHDKNQVARLVGAAEIAPGELVLEVGPGTGTLTEALLDAGAEVIAAEIDEDLADLIEQRLGERVEMVRGDCLESGRRLSGAIVAALGDRPFKLVANLPYQVASALIAGLLMDHPACRGQYVTIQREVADRLAAAPSTPDYGPLSIIVQALGEVRRIALVKPASFWPPPAVQSAMVAITPRGNEPPCDPARLARFARELFTKRRKQLGTIFGRDHTWPAGIDPQVRPEALSVEQVIELGRSVGAL